MDWSNLVMEEIEDYCKSKFSFFDVFPLSMQIEDIISMFYYYHIDKFNIEDIKEFYKRLQIPKLSGEGIRKPTLGQIKKALSSKLITNVHIQYIGNDSYEILSADTSIYIETIKKYGH